MATAEMEALLKQQEMLRQQHSNLLQSNYPPTYSPTYPPAQLQQQYAQPIPQPGSTNPINPVLNAEAENPEELQKEYMKTERGQKLAQALKSDFDEWRASVKAVPPSTYDLDSKINKVESLVGDLGKSVEKMNTQFNALLTRLGENDD